MVERACCRSQVLGVLLGLSACSLSPCLGAEGEAPPRESSLAIEAVIRQASERLEKPACQMLFSDFRDRQGRTLRQNLASTGQTGRTYLDQMVFYGASHYRHCQDPNLFAVTSPGSHAVFLCSSRLIQRYLWDRDFVVAVIIHEELHSLGLGENPPDSSEISRQVLLRCGR